MIASHSVWYSPL